VTRFQSATEAFWHDGLASILVVRVRLLELPVKGKETNIYRVRMMLRESSTFKVIVCIVESLSE
jgi:hypothetical protein